MKVFTTPVAAWLNEVPIDCYSDREYCEIIRFFIFNSPCEGLSARSVSLSKYGWSAPWSKPYYLNKQLLHASSEPIVLAVADSYDEMDNALKKADLDDMEKVDLAQERICIFNNLRNHVLSTFYHVRNSFAHGRFNIYPLMDASEDWVFLLEDVSPKANKNGNKMVSARAVIKKSTLLHWIAIIVRGETTYEAQK